MSDRPFMYHTANNASIEVDGKLDVALTKLLETERMTHIDCYVEGTIVLINFASNTAVSFDKDSEVLREVLRNYLSGNLYDQFGTIYS